MTNQGFQGHWLINYYVLVFRSENVEEGQLSQSKADFIAKYSIACKEARETHYWLKLFLASEIVTEEQLSRLMIECDQLISILTVIIKKVKAKKVFRVSLNA